MYDLASMESALQNARKSGDTAAAKVIESELFKAKTAAQIEADRQTYDPSKGGGTLQIGLPGYTLDTGLPTTERLERGLAGAGKALTDIARGAGQWVGQVSRDDVKEAKRLDAPLMKTTAGTVGNVAGNIVAMAPTVLLPGANTIAGATAYGALSGALQPSISANETINNIGVGGALSAGVTGAVRALPALKQAIVDPFTSAGRERITGDVLRRFGVNANAVPEASVVPGVQRTLAEATRDAGAAQLERAASAASVDSARLIGERQLSNNQAMIGSLERIAGTERDRELARGVRGYMSGPLYQQAMDEGIPQAVRSNPAIAARLENLMQRPEIEDAMRAATRLARSRGAAAPANPATTLDGLHNTALALDDIIQRASNPTNALGRNELNALMQTRNDLRQFLADVSPTYAQASREFATWSGPVNRGEVGRELLNRLEPALTEAGGVRLNPSSYANAVRGDAATVNRAAGVNRPMAEVMTPPEMTQIQGVLSDLARRSFAAEAGRVPGSPTAQYLAGGNALRSVLGPLGLPQGWGEGVLAQTLAGRGLSAMARPAEQRLQETLAQALLDPQMAVRLMNAQPSRTAQGLSALSRYTLPPIAAGAAAGYSTQK